MVEVVPIQVVHGRRLPGGPGVEIQFLAGEQTVHADVGMRKIVLAHLPVIIGQSLVSLTDQGHQAVNTYIPRALAFGTKLQEGCSAEEIAIAYRMLEIIRVRALELVPPIEPAPDPKTPPASDEFANG